MTKRDVIITISTSRLDSGLQFFQDNNCTYTINLDETEPKPKKEMPPPTKKACKQSDSSGERGARAST